MSQANVEIARRAMDALNQFGLMVGGSDPLPTLREFCDPSVEWDFSQRGIIPRFITATTAGRESLSSSAMPDRSFAWR
jgi:hypothetical protein